MTVIQRGYQVFVLSIGVLAFFLLSGFGIFGHKKYETPITKETLQPDKVLYDKAIKNIEHANYEAARLTLNTLINTYDTSEYLAKAKLAIADSWFREGGVHGLAQAEAEYKDFILFYPNMEEAAESQFKVCNIHFKQMDKADRDSTQGQRAEDECRQVMVAFPNSKFVTQAQQMLRDVQEVLADKEFRTGMFYHHKGSFPAAANRLSFVAQQYPLYSSADEALWLNADADRHMGDRFEDREADSLTRIVRDYPLSAHVNAAKERLTAMKRPVPQADPAAYARMKYDLENRQRLGLVRRAITTFESRPDVSLAAKNGAPAMQSVRPAVPVSVPAIAAGGQNGISDVSATVAGNSEAIDKEPEARLGTPPAAGTGEGEQKAALAARTAPGETASDAGTQTAANAVSTASLPTNHPPTKAQLAAYKKQQEKAAKDQKKAAAKSASATAATTATTPGTTPGTATVPATTSTTPAAVKQ